MFCPIQSATAQHLDRLEANEVDNNNLWLSARDRVDSSDLIDDMENEATDIVLACDRVEQGQMTIEELGRFVMARRDWILEQLTKQQF
jgi:hypothetical protein